MPTEISETTEKTIWNTKEKCTVCKDKFHSKNDMRAIQNTKMCTVCVAELAVRDAIKDNS